jgi:hypothetical protein
MELHYYDPARGEYRLKRRLLWGLWGLAAGLVAGSMASWLLN